jgi:opacity protein-like surface antigen
VTRRLLLACALALPVRAAAQAAQAAAASDEDEDEEEDDGAGARAMSIGLRGSKGREANTRDFDWGPTLSLEIMQSRKERSSRFKYELELSYNDAMTASRSGDTSQSTRVRTAEFRYAKISMLELFGFDLRNRTGIVPYAAGGIQHVDSREDSTAFDEDLGEFASTTSRNRYWSPSFGVGAEVSLNTKVTLALDYNQNIASGDRRVERLSLELKVAVFGAD